MKFVKLRLKIRLLRFEESQMVCRLFCTKPTYHATLFKLHAVNLRAGDGLLESHKERG